MYKNIKFAIQNCVDNVLCADRMIQKGGSKTALNKNAHSEMKSEKNFSLLVNGILQNEPRRRPFLSDKMATTNIKSNITKHKSININEI